MGLIKCPHDMTAGDPRDTKVVAEHVFYDLVLEATLESFSQYSFGVPGQPCLMCKETTKGVNIMRIMVSHVGDYHKYLQPCRT